MKRWQVTLYNQHDQRGYTGFGTTRWNALLDALSKAPSEFFTVRTDGRSIPYMCGHGWWLEGWNRCVDRWSKARGKLTAVTAAPVLGFAVELRKLTGYRATVLKPIAAKERDALIDKIWGDDDGHS